MGIRKCQGYIMSYQSIACGFRHSVAIREDRSLIQWGNKEYDQLKNYPPPDTKFKKIRAGGTYTVAIKDDDTLIQWGDDTENERQNLPPPDTKVKEVNGGSNHSLAIKDDDTLIQWGDERGEKKKNFPPPGTKVKAIACGDGHSIAIKDDDTLIQWGANDENQNHDFPPPSTKVKAISCGFNHSLAIKDDDTLIQWGDTSAEQDNKFPPPSTKVKAIACGSFHCVAIKDDDTLIQWGNDSVDQLKDLPPPGTKVKAVACGNTHCVAIKDDGTLIQWGNTDSDQRDGFPGVTLDVTPIKKLEAATPEVLDPNPYPKYLKKLPDTPLPKKPFNYKSDTKASDPIMGDDIPIDSILADDEHPLIIKVGDTLTVLPRDYLKSGIDDGSLIRFGCNKALGLAVYPANIYGKNPLLYIKGLVSGNFAVLLDEAVKVLDDLSIKAIELTDSGDEFTTVTSFHSVYDPSTNLNYYGSQVNLVGADHCQAGSSQKIYKITTLDLVKTGGRRKRKTYRKKKLISKKKRQTHKK
jgi:alpha-tubulin suppressor-like RCC1 family protein